MIEVGVAGSAEDVRGFLERCRHFTLAESLGGVESLISLPALNDSTGQNLSPTPMVPQIQP